MQKDPSQNIVIYNINDAFYRLYWVELELILTTLYIVGWLNLYQRVMFYKMII